MFEMKIDTDTICSFCEKKIGMSQNTCKEEWCSKAQNAYYETYKALPVKKSIFKNLRPGDKVYVLNVATPIPEIEVKEISSISTQIDASVDLIEKNIAL